MYSARVINNVYLHLANNEIQEKLKVENSLLAPKVWYFILQEIAFFYSSLTRLYDIT